jgi:hypothetical protein
VVRALPRQDLDRPGGVWLPRRQRQRCRRGCLGAAGSGGGREGCNWVAEWAESGLGADLVLAALLLATPPRRLPCHPRGICWHVGLATRRFVSVGVSSPCYPLASAFLGCVVCPVKVVPFAQRLQDRGCRGGSPGWWDPCGLTGEPKVLVLVGAMDMGLSWCLAGCGLWGYWGCHLGGFPRHVWVGER